MSRPRVLIAGLGDSGLLTAIKLARHADVVGISVKPALVSGQELGLRLARPKDWARDNWIPFEKFRGLDRVRTVQATLQSLNPEKRTVTAETADGTGLTEPYDVLVISTGVSNGFWRRPTLQSPEDVAADLRAPHDTLAAADSVIVIGGGAAAVSTAANLAATWPDKKIDLYFPGERPLPEHHPRTWERLQHRMIQLGVGLHPGHRALRGRGADLPRCLRDEPRGLQLHRRRLRWPGRRGRRRLAVRRGRVRLLRVREPLQDRRVRVPAGAAVRPQLRGPERGPPRALPPGQVRARELRRLRGLRPGHREVPRPVRERDLPRGRHVRPRAVRGGQLLRPRLRRRRALRRRVV